jgi:hypothetical protein
MDKQNAKWYLITIEDPEGLPGKNILNVIQLIMKVMNFNFVILNDINGAGKYGVVLSLQENENIVLKIEELLKVLNDITQFDWGDFFLFKQYPNKLEIFENKLYPERISQTETTIRAIDDTYIYIYTPYKEIVDVIKENYEIESIKIDSLENLDYPQ